MNAQQIPSPVAIGGLGGSGTRVVAQILQSLGFWLGADLNEQVDNLWFTLLFKRPSCLRDLQLLHYDAIAVRYAIFVNAMQGKRPSFTAWPTLLRATLETAWHGHNHLHEGRGAWAFQRLRSIAQPPLADPQQYAGWGWKEPNTHVYLQFLFRHDPQLRYIHVLRHGLDMAFSHNEQQIRLWAPLYDLHVRPTQPLTPAQKLKFWVSANFRAQNMGHAAGASRFLIVRFDDLCDRPHEVIAQITAFVGRSSGPSPDRLAALIKAPATRGRYRQQDLSQFEKRDLEKVEEFGFKI